MYNTFLDNDGFLYRNLYDKNDQLFKRKHKEGKLEYAGKNNWSEAEPVKGERCDAHRENTKVRFENNAALSKHINERPGSAAGTPPPRPDTSPPRITTFVSGTCREWFDRYLPSYKNATGNDALMVLQRDVEAAIGGSTLVEVREDAQQRLVFVLDSGGKTYDMVVVQKNMRGEYAVVSYDRIFRPGQNPSVDVGVSENRMAPDYTKDRNGNTTTQYLFPEAQLPYGRSAVVKIRMSGKRKGTDGDFHRSNIAAGIDHEYGIDPPPGYAWHHMDDYTVDAHDTAWCTMQLVRSDKHTRVRGMAHSGSVAQWKKDYLALLNVPDNTKNLSYDD